MKRRIHVDPEDFDGYAVRTDKTGKFGIYTRGYNCRLAKFNANTYHLQRVLAKLFDRAAAPSVPKKRKRKPIISGAFAMDVGDNQGWGKKR